MALTQINSPQLIKIENTGNNTVGFVPYRENYTYALEAGKTIELTATTSGQALYYLKQATDNLAVTFIGDFDEATEDIVVIGLPATVTLANKTATALNFVPYKENFGEQIAAGDTLTFTATTVGQVLYYLAQANYGFTVSQTHSM